MKRKSIYSLVVLAMVMMASCTEKINTNNGNNNSFDESVIATRSYDNLPDVTLDRIIDMNSESSSVSISRHEGNGTYKLEMGTVDFSLSALSEDTKVVLFRNLEYPSGISMGYIDQPSGNTLQPSLDLPLLQIDFTVKNPTAEPVVFKANLVSYKAGKQVSAIHIGDNNNDDEFKFIEVAPGAETKFILSESGKLGYDDNAVKVSVDGLSSLFLDFPDEIGFENISINENASFAAAIPVEFSFELSAPLALGGRSNFMTTYDLYGLDFTMPDDAGDDMSIKSVDVEYSVKSAVPALFTYDVYPIDDDGNVIEGLTCGGFGNAFAGTANKPSVCENLIHIEKKVGYESLNLIEKVKGLRMSIFVRGDSDDRHQVTPLSSFNYLQFYDIKMNFECCYNN